MSRKLVAPYVMLILLLAIFVMPTNKVFAADVSAELSQAEQIATLKLFYEKRLMDIGARIGHRQPTNFFRKTRRYSL